MPEFGPGFLTPVCADVDVREKPIDTGLFELKITELEDNRFHEWTNSE